MAHVRAAKAEAYLIVPLGPLRGSACSEAPSSGRRQAMATSGEKWLIKASAEDMERRVQKIWKV